MTSLSIAEALDPRIALTAGSSPARGVTPGAAAFADVIQDASRMSAADTTSASADTTSEDVSPDPGQASSPATALVPPAIIPTPETAPSTTAGDTAFEFPSAGGEAPAAPTTTPADDGSTDAAGSATVSLAAPAGSIDSMPAAESAALVDAQRLPLPAESGPTRMSAAVTPSLPGATTGVAAGASAHAAAALVGAVDPTGVAPTPTTSRLSVAGGSTPGGPGVAEVPSGSTPTASTPTAMPRVFAATTTAPDASTEAPIDPASAGAAPTAATPLPSAVATPSTDALAPPPAVGNTPPASPTPPAAAPIAIPVARPVLLLQITAPVVSLAQAPDGDHSLTLTVSPENLGPVTVRAHISGGAIHIELHAPTDLGRDALRAILADLRRDLAVAAPHASLALSTADDGPGSSHPQHSAHGNGSPTGNGSNAPSSGTGGGQPGAGTPADREAHGARSTRDGLPPMPDTAPHDPQVSPHGGIEVFA